MEQNHIHNHPVNINSAFKTGIILNIIFIASEAAFGLLSNSMALLADAGHNLSDLLALIFSWIAVYLSGRKPTLKFTYGFRRSTILIALLNTILLLVAAAFIIYMNIVRLKRPEAVNANSVMIVAAIGVGVNAFTAFLFNKTKHDLNIRSAFAFVADPLNDRSYDLSILLPSSLQWIDTDITQ
jgi:cobalt-zinc-cadmium efflux system protein